MAAETALAMRALIWTAARTGNLLGQLFAGLAAQGNLMENVMKPLISLLIGYILAAPLTTLVSLDMRQTEWFNLLTYFWIVASAAVWVSLIFAILFVLSWGSNK
jgi:hypothetical protein